MSDRLPGAGDGPARVVFGVRLQGLRAKSLSIQNEKASPEGLAILFTLKSKAYALINPMLSSFSRT